MIGDWRPDRFYMTRRSNKSYARPPITSHCFATSLSPLPTHFVFISRTGFRSAIFCIRSIRLPFGRLWYVGGNKETWLSQIVPGLLAVMTDRVSSVAATEPVVSVALYCAHPMLSRPLGSERRRRCRQCSRYQTSVRWQQLGSQRKSGRLKGRSRRASPSERPHHTHPLSDTIDPPPV
jgi:hypothetical protein